MPKDATQSQKHEVALQVQPKASHAAQQQRVAPMTGPLMSRSVAKGTPQMKIVAADLGHQDRAREFCFC